MKRVNVEFRARKAVQAAVQSGKPNSRMEHLIALDLKAAYQYANKVLKGAFVLAGKHIISAGVEGRVEYVIRTAGEKLGAALKADHEASQFRVKTVEDLVKNMAEKCDPTNDKTYLVGIANKYIKGLIKVEDFETLKGGLVIFNKFRQKMTVKDFNAFKTMRDFWDAVEPFEDAKTGKEIRMEEKKGADLIMKDDNFAAYELKTKEAAISYGKGTKWCTSGDSNNMFDTYHSRGRVFAVIFKNLGGKLRKFQLQMESGQFMDEKNSLVGSSDIALMSKEPMYAKFLNYLIDLYYKKDIEETKAEIMEIRKKNKKVTSGVLITIV